MEPDIQGIHQFSALDRYYAYDLFRLQTYELSERADKLLRNTLQESAASENSNPSPSPEDRRCLQQLAGTGLLDKSRQTLRIKRTDKPLKPCVHGININVIEDCNCACTYCFAKGGTYHSNRREHMGLDIGKAAVNWIVERGPADEAIRLCFFGGEPLLNLPLIHALVPYADNAASKTGKSFVYNLETNGTLLNSCILSTLDNLRVRVDLSIDGIGPEQDAHRKFIDGTGTWASLSEPARLLVNNGRKTTARATLARGNVKLSKIVHDLLDFGFSKVLVAWSTGSFDGAITTDETEQIMADIDRLGREYCDRMLAEDSYLTGFLNLQKKISRLQEPGFTWHGCGAGTRSFTIRANGDIHVCQAFIHPDNPFRLGNVTTNEFDQSGRRRFQALSVDEKEDCSRCWGRYLCGNQCMALNYRMGKGFNRCDNDFCRIELKLWETAIALAAQFKQTSSS